jgi:hypothetical protein
MAPRDASAIRTLTSGRLSHAGATALLLMYLIYLAGRSLFFASAAYF